MLAHLVGWRWRQAVFRGRNLSSVVAFGNIQGDHQFQPLRVMKTTPLHAAGGWKLALNGSTRALNHGAHALISAHHAMKKMNTHTASQAGYAEAMKIHLEDQGTPMTTATFALALAVASLVLLIATPVSVCLVSFIALVASIYFCYWQSDHLEFLLLAVGFGWVQMNTEIAGAPIDWAATGLAVLGTMAALGICYFNETASKKDL